MRFTVNCVVVKELREKLSDGVFEHFCTSNGGDTSEKYYLP